MASKKKCQIRHAIKRAKERYNIYLRFEDIPEIVKLIQSEQSNLILKKSIRVSIHEVLYLNKKLIVVYDSLRENIVTFLPLNFKQRIDNFNDTFLREMEEKDYENNI